MKKIFSILVCLLMIASIAASSVSAAGQILFEDKFDSMDNEDWCWEPSHFYVENGILVGDPTAVVHQTMYGANPPVDRTWSQFTCRVETRITDYTDSTDIGPGLWFKDYNTTWAQDEEGEEDTGEIWTFQYNHYNNTCTLASDYFANNNMETITYPVPEGTIKIGPDDKPTTFSLGWRVQPGRIQCYLNDKLVIDCDRVPMDLGTIRKSPILLINKSCYIEFDNFVVATVDYNLFNEPDTPAPVGPGNNGGNQQPGNATEIVTEYETNDKGETIVVTKVVADTNANNPSANNGGSNTGDMIVAVAAVMAVAAAGAIVAAKRREH